MMDPTAAEEAFDLSFRRAMMAEAAFQAMMDMEREVLEEEGYVDEMQNVMLKIGPQVNKICSRCHQSHCTNCPRSLTGANRPTPKAIAQLRTPGLKTGIASKGRGP